MAAATIGTIAVLLAGTILVLAFVIGRRGPVRGEVGLDDRGDELLRLECPRCADGTRVKIGGGEGTFNRGSAIVPLTQELTIGDNELTITLRHPDGRAEDVNLLVPVDYRLGTDLAALSATPPMVRVNVAAGTDTAVIVDGRPVALDNVGRGAAEIDVSQSLTGAMGTIVSLDRSIPYSVTRRRAEVEHGELIVRIGVVPLVVDAPGRSIVIDTATFWLAGRTLRGGTVTVSGRPITVDPAGRFAQLMNVSAVGETTIYIRAEAPNHAPRLVPLRVRRVDSLRAEAARLATKSVRSYTSISDNASAKKDWEVMLEGDIVDARINNHTTVLVLNIKTGCEKPPCLVRAVHGAKLAMGGTTVTIHGFLAGMVDWNRVKIPEVQADFILAGSIP